MRDTLYIGSVEYERCTLLLNLENLFFLQREALRSGQSVSELLNQIIHTHTKEITQ